MTQLTITDKLQNLNHDRRGSDLQFLRCFFSELQELEVRICAQPNFPIIILILLNGFHKFARSMGPNTSVYGLCLTAFPQKGYKSLIIPFFCNQVYHKGPPHPLLSWLLIFFLNFVYLISGVRLFPNEDAKSEQLSHH